MVCFVVGVFCLLFAPGGFGGLCVYVCVLGVFLLLLFVVVLLDLELSFWKTLQEYLRMSGNSGQCLYFPLDAYWTYLIGKARVS